MKKIILSLAAFAVATLSFSQYFVENFENGGVFPSGWGLSNGVDDWAIDMGENYGSGSAQSGTYSAYFNEWSYSNGTTADMISPKIDLSTATNPELVFWYYDDNGSDVVEVLTSLDSSAFATVYTTSTTVTPWTEITVDLTSLAGQSNVWISFRGLRVWGVSNPHVDNIIVKEAPTCPDPSALSATVISSDSVSIDWTENAGATSWYVEYGVSPLTQGTGTKVLTNNPDTLIGLLANTTYNYYVKSICGTGDSSNWGGPASFTTPCPPFFTPTYSQDFAIYMPNCWSEAEGKLEASTTLSGGSSWWDGGDFGYVGSKSAYINVYDDDQYHWLLTPVFDLGNGSTSYQAEFDIALTEYDVPSSGSLGNDDTIAFVISTDAGVTWSSANILQLWDTANNTLVPAGTHIIVDLTSYTGQVMFGFYGGSAISAAEDNDIYIDNFEINARPGCPQPVSLMANNITTTSVDIDWTESGAAVAWDLRLDTAGFSLASSSFELITSKAHAVNSLDDATNYEYYVRSICGAGDTSLWAGPFGLTTLCLPITPSYSQDFSSYIPTCWSEATGELGANVSLNNGASSFHLDTFAHAGLSTAATVNVYNDDQYDWLLSPVIDLGNGSVVYQAEFDIALTEYDDIVAGTLGDDDTVAFVISTDAGATWSSANILELWDTANNTLIPAGTHVVVDLTSYTGNVMFGFYGASSISAAEDNDIFIDNFEVVMSPSTSIKTTNDFNFNMFPNPNNGDFVITTNGNEQDLTVNVLSTIGQVIYSSRLTSNKTNINLSNVAKGSYIVRVYNNNTSAQEMIIIK